MGYRELHRMEIEEVVRRWQVKESQRAIARATGLAPETVKKYLAAASDLGLSATVRSDLDGFALGRTRRIIEAPDLLTHAAADAESWPFVETAVQKTLALARSRGVQLNASGQARLTQALALSAVQGVLLAEWRQLEDGQTIWDGASARIRASDAFAIQHIIEATERRQLPELFAGIARRPQDFEVRLLLPYALATAFYLRLHGPAPNASAA